MNFPRSEEKDSQAPITKFRTPMPGFDRGKTRTYADERGMDGMFACNARKSAEFRLNLVFLAHDLPGAAIPRGAPVFRRNNIFESFELTEFFRRA